MKSSEHAAIEINQLWRDCLAGADVEDERCPTNEQVAEIIERHMHTGEE